MQEEPRSVDCLAEVSFQSISTFNQSKESLEKRRVLNALKRAGGYESWEELVFLLTNELRTKSGSEQISLGRVLGRRVKVIAISGLDQIKAHSPLVIQMRLAMEECLDCGAPTVCQENSNLVSVERAPDYRLLRKWHESAGRDPVACFPLRGKERIEYIIGLRRSRTSPFTSSMIEDSREMANPFTPALLLMEKAQRKLFKHAVDSLGLLVRRFFMKGRWLVKFGQLAILGIAIWFFLGTLSYRVVVPGVILPREMQHLSAPEAGVLREVQCFAGQRVQAGQELCRFDDTELKREKNRLEKELEGILLDKRDLVSAQDPVSVQLSETNEERLRRRLDAIQKRIDRHVVRAPVDGTILSGDLRGRIGDQFARGESLFQIQGDQGWLLQLQVPERRIVGLNAGLPGTFRLYAQPEKSHQIYLLRFAPVASQREGKNVFLVEASAEFQGDWVRAGMRGMARVEIGPRPVWWVLLHSPIDYLRIKLWI